ncbi:colanic acid biosynthesis pyruvyl transferase WcaK [Shewanella algidipiscicola]|uniref:colanic acid biosynthesis pyruvyl transferase WcaK n=1 Tax=Shewanella algidipiscicola TaxID=614070 RepID=UPI000D788BEB|nr:colanic acid biosynthesis pyruvyl transferase WcaK [Shewanella algidipiscicola]
MNNKRVLIAGNHTCGNRGDSAILRGLISCISRAAPNIELVINSRFPESSAYLLTQPVIADPLAKYRTKTAKTLKSKIIKRLASKFISKILLLKLQHKKLASLLPLPEAYKQYIQDLSQYDAVIQVGGSFYVDAYGVSQFDNALCTLVAEKPLIFIGHSVGPFGDGHFAHVSKSVFSRTPFLGLRESVSLELINQLFENDLPAVDMGSDTAWLVDQNVDVTPLPFQTKRKIVAITVRELAPFDRTLGIEQSAYERKMATICQQLIAQGYAVLAISTCTGIDGYPKDDRMVALRIQSLCDHDTKAHFYVAMDEYNDVQLGSLLSQCVLTIGTRLHSAIISMNFGTPAFALNYEHKSKGIMEGLGLDKFAIPLTSFMNGDFEIQLSEQLKDLDSLRELTSLRVSLERQKTIAFVERALKEIL